MQAFRFKVAVSCPMKTLTFSGLAISAYGVLRRPAQRFPDGPRTAVVQSTETAVRSTETPVQSTENAVRSTEIAVR